MDLLLRVRTIASTICYLLAIPFGLTSRAVNKVGTDFIAMGDKVYGNTDIKKVAEEWRKNHE